MKSEVVEGSRLQALLASFLLGVVVGAGTYCIIAFWGRAMGPPESIIVLGTRISAAAIGIATAGIMFWLFLTHRVNARDIWQSIKDFWHELGKQPF